MYFWKITKLKEDLINHGLSERQFFIYVLISLSLSSIAAEFCNYFPSKNPNFWDYTQSCLIVIILIIGTFWAYRANGGSEGRDFAARYFSISMVVGLRFLVYFSPLMILYFFYGFYKVYQTREALDFLKTDGFEVFVFSGLYVMYFWRLVGHIGNVANSKMKCNS